MNEITVRVDRLLDEASKLNFNVKGDGSTDAALTHLRAIQSIARKVEMLIEGKLGI